METKNNWKAWLYLAPVLILLAVFTFYPIINTFIISFLGSYNITNGNNTGFTLNNYIQILSPSGVFFNDVMATALPNTLLITFITVPISIVLALLIAIGLNSIPAVKKVLQTIFFLPYVTNSIAIGMVFAVIFDSRYGVFNTILGTQISWLTYNPNTQLTVNYWNALFALCFYIVWHSLPYKILIFLGGLQNIDQQYYEAAKVDGAGRIKTTWKVTVPLLSPQILYVMITSFIGAFKEYDSVIGLFGDTGGSFDSTTGPDTMQTVVYFIYNHITSNISYGAAAAVILFVIILIFTALQFAVSKRRVHY